MSNHLSNNLFETNEESDDSEEDIDYKPEKEVSSHESGSDSEEEDNEYRKGKHKKTTEEVKPEVEEKLTEEQLKQKSDSLWEEFCKDLPKTNETNDLSTNSVNKESDKSAGNSSAKSLITKTYDFAGQEVSVTEEVESNSSKADNNSNKSDVKQDDSKAPIGPPKAMKRTGGLGSIIDQLKKPKITTLNKSAIDWNDFKKSEGIEDELKAHNKSRDTFTERQAFLQRTDLRQFEIEKQIREKNRSQRQLSKD